MVAGVGGVGIVDVDHHKDHDQLEMLAANAIVWTSFVRRHAHVQPVDVALRSDGEGVSYQELDARFDRIATAFSRLGVTVGGRVESSWPTGPSTSKRSEASCVWEPLRCPLTSACGSRGGPSPAQQRDHPPARRCREGAYCPGGG